MSLYLCILFGCVFDPQTNPLYFTTVNQQMKYVETRGSSDKSQSENEPSTGRLVGFVQIAPSPNRAILNDWCALAMGASAMQSKRVA